MKLYSYLFCSHFQGGPQWLSQYNDSLRAGRSGFRVLVVEAVLTGPGAHPASYTMRTASLSLE